MTHQRKDPPHNWSFDHGEWYGHIPPSHTALKKRVGWKGIDQDYVQQIKSERGVQLDRAKVLKEKKQHESKRIDDSPKFRRESNGRNSRDDEDNLDDVGRVKTPRRRSCVTTKHIIMALAMSLLITSVCFIVFFPDIKVEDEELWRWFLVLSGAVGAWLLIDPALYITDTCMQLVFMGESLLVYLILSLHGTRCFFFHVVVTFGLWAGLMKDVTFYTLVTRLLGCLWVFAGALLLNRVLIKWFHHGFYRKTFFEQMYRATQAEYLMILLQKKILGEQFHLEKADTGWVKITRVVTEIKKASGTEFSTSFSAKLFGQRDLLLSQPHMMHRMARYLMKNKQLPVLQPDPTGSDNGTVAFLVDKDQGEKLGKKMFRALRESKMSHELYSADLQNIFAAEELVVFYELIDVSEEEPISMTTLAQFFGKLVTDRLSLSLTLRDAEDVLGKLGWATGCILGIPTVTFWLVIFDVNVLELWLAVASLLVSLSFIFGGSIRSVYENIIFIFVIHPFDVNDWLQIGDDMYMVQQIGMHTTTLKKVDGKSCFCRTTDMNNTILQNLTRSDNAWEVFDLVVDIETPSWVFLRLSERLEELFELDKDIYSQFRLVYRDLKRPLKIKLCIIVEFQVNASKLADLHWGRSRLLAAVREVLADSHVKYSMHSLQGMLDEEAV